MKPVLLVLTAALAVAIVGAAYAFTPRTHQWSGEELAAMRELWIGSLPPLPPDPSNRHAADPGAAALGEQLFFDTRLSSNGQVSCATCHQPQRAFADNLPLAQAVGVTDRKTPTIVGAAYSPWQFWDGRKDSLWAQALGPLESPVEHGGTRTQYAHLVAEFYRIEYEALFGHLPDLSDPARFPATAGPVPDPVARAAWEAMQPEDREAVNVVYANLGKAIAAFERRLVPAPSRFDTYVEAVLAGDPEAAENSLSPDERDGLRLFLGKADCTQCHSGPLFSNNDFHNVGVPTAHGLPPDPGRARGAQQVLADEFNCLSQYSDAGPDDCGELRFIKLDEHQTEGAFKTPSLRNVADRAPYMHAGQFATLAQVLDHYNRAPQAEVGHSELEPLHLTPTELAQLEAFLRTLNGSVAASRHTAVHSEK